jgi:tetratricopeptide (TPR) repeat protein
VDKLCQEIDGGQASSCSGESDEYDATDDEVDEEQVKEKAEWHKERGNQFFKDNMLTEAIECYTKAMDLNPLNAIYPANRAMCFLKQDQ